MNQKLEVRKAEDLEISKIVDLVANLRVQCFKYKGIIDVYNLFLFYLEPFSAYFCNKSLTVEIRVPPNSIFEILHMIMGMDNHI